MITSFNEWHENTQIEATAGTAGTTNQDDSVSRDYYTQSDYYTDYGYLYLDILRQETCYLEGDLDKDGDVDFNDLKKLADNWLEGT